jgi:uncharacterized coiled-coil DUF342 family protein
MNQDLAQILTNIDAMINSISVDPVKAKDSQMATIISLRNEMQSKLDSYNATIAKANEDVRKELDAKARQIQERINYLLQPKP